MHVGTAARKNNNKNTMFVFSHCFVPSILICLFSLLGSLLCSFCFFPFSFLVSCFVFFCHPSLSPCSFILFFHFLSSCLMFFSSSPCGRSGPSSLIVPYSPVLYGFFSHSLVRVSTIFSRLPWFCFASVSRFCFSHQFVSFFLFACFSSIFSGFCPISFASHLLLAHEFVLLYLSLLPSFAFSHSLGLISPSS